MGVQQSAKGEEFRTTGSVVVGWIGLVTIAAVLALGLFEMGTDFPVWGLALCGLLATLVWSALVRPRIRVVGPELELRGMLDTVTVPLAGVCGVAVRQVVVLRVAERRYVSAAVSRSLREITRGTPRGEPSYAGLVEQRLQKLSDDARALRGIEADSEEQWALVSEVRSSRAWPEIALLVGLSVVLLVAALG
ncbi:hypothetical protein E8D34_10995 [Nocardioides sp. GY 10113]|uniref:hypothetical protein n=1 Tax=Nocardioides sp. GY 10113 TaxID=2569761 RepID=UPI0010A89BC7|nr:hypothetical protein [Nocardioides sp. GY 10113]TIC86762.1 hypothetical protein E8D34_10995 [Nocardioides sp. GY 10113]